MPDIPDIFFFFGGGGGGVCWVQAYISRKDDSTPSPLGSLRSAMLNLSHFVKNSEYDQEIPQSQTADNPVAPRGRAAQPSRDTRKTN